MFNKGDKVRFKNNEKDQAYRAAQFYDVDTLEDTIFTVSNVDNSTAVIVYNGFKASSYFDRLELVKGKKEVFYVITPNFDLIRYNNYDEALDRVKKLAENNNGLSYSVVKLVATARCEKVTPPVTIETF